MTFLTLTGIFIAAVASVVLVDTFVEIVILGVKL